VVQVLKLASVRPGDGEWLHVSTADIKGVSTAGQKLTEGAPAVPSASPGSGSLRVVLGRKLASGTTDWEEGAPEDLLQTLRFTAALGATVLHGMSSRVRSRCDAAVAKLEAVTARAFAVAAQHRACPGGGTVPKRSVLQEVRTALEDCARTLLVPGVFCDPRNASSSVVAKLVAQLGAGPQSLDLLSVIATNFSASIATAAVQGFLGQVGVQAICTR
jgi:hypothetical protein